MDSRKYNVIIFGADGCTGRYTVEAMVEYHKTPQNKKITWAIAGRSDHQLKEALEDISVYTGVDCRSVERIVADAADIPALMKMAGMCDLLISCVGPFRFFGENVLQACLSQKTHYIGAGGEVQYLMKSQMRFNHAAEAYGLYMVESCGMASILADCGTLFLQENIQGVLNGVELISDTDTALKSRRANIASYVAYVYILGNPRERKRLENDSLAGYPKSWDHPLPARGLLHYNDLLRSWCSMNPQCDTNVAQRSQSYFYASERRRPVQVKSYIRMPSWTYAVITLLYGFFLFTWACFPPTRWVLLKFPRFFSMGMVNPGERIPREILSSIPFTLHIFGHGWTSTERTQQGPPNKIFKAQVTCKNPAYGATGVMLIQSAWTLLFEKDKLPPRGGVFTPGAAFLRTSLLERLRDNDIRFELLDL